MKLTGIRRGIRYKKLRWLSPYNTIQTEDPRITQSGWIKRDCIYVNHLYIGVAEDNGQEKVENPIFYQRPILASEYPLRDEEVKDKAYDKAFNEMKTIVDYIEKHKKWPTEIKTDA